MRRTDIVDALPPFLWPAYRVSVRRSPSSRLIDLPPEWFHHAAGPVYGHIPVGPDDWDLTAGHEGEPIGQRMILTGRVLDSDRRPVPNAMLEIWQTNAAGRYLHPFDPFGFPLDPNFDGVGRCLTDSEGRYRFVTVRPAPYPQRNGGPNDWRAAHIHVSIFGTQLPSRLITQLYFPDDPLLDSDVILGSVPDPRGRERLICSFDWSETVPESALGFRWDIVLRGRDATPTEDPS